MARFEIVVDTREKEPYIFSSPSVRRKLDAGDYSVTGFEHRVAVERKSMEDLVNTILRGRERFTKELKKLSSLEMACVVVEAEYMDLLSGKFRSGANPTALAGLVFSVIVDFKIPVFFMSNRQASIYFVEGYLSRFFARKGNRG